MEIPIGRDILSANDALAARNRALFNENRVLVLNVMGSPGAGKTEFLVQILKILGSGFAAGIIVGDISTAADAERYDVLGLPVVQINTDRFGGDCHLGAHLIEKALGHLDLAGLDLLVIENVGNLVCPAEFDLGEDLRVVVLSIAEGEDKPVKYPLMFRECDAVVLGKMDLLPYLQYDMARVRANLDSIHPQMIRFEVSARTGAGLEIFLPWLRDQIRRKSPAR